MLAPREGSQAESSLVQVETQRRSGDLPNAAEQRCHGTLNRIDSRYRRLLVTSLGVLLFSVLTVFVAAKQPYLSSNSPTRHTSKATIICERARAITRELRRNNSPRVSREPRRVKAPFFTQRPEPALLSEFLQLHPFRSPPMA